MEMCLEAACKLAVVERRPGRSSDIDPSTKEIIGPYGWVPSPLRARSEGYRVSLCVVGL
jgi:hypothetical protein